MTKVLPPCGNLLLTSKVFLSMIMLALYVLNTVEATLPIQIPAVNCIIEVIVRST
jgi:hypothetical protein